MGLLDDAIKEHLELKRRRGADPGEIARQETEALGPVRRGEVDLAVRPTPAPVDEEPAYEDEEPFGESGPRPSGHEPEPEEESATPPHGDPLGEAALGRHEHGPHPGHVDDLASTPPHGDPLAHQPTRQFSAEEVREALGERADAPAPRRDPDVVSADASDEEDEDVLEETPEFLQETPEHDRLWFEQKPPKDFDF
jgi:hypothetical protein